MPQPEEATMTCAEPACGDPREDAGAGRQTTRDEADRRALEAYRFESSSNSLLRPWLDPIWFDPLLRRVPASFPANGLTAGSLGFLLLGFALCVVGAAVDGLHALFLAAAACFWLCDSLDNLDGPHARRTNTSGPLGELLDHGADTIGFVLVPLGVALALDLAAVHVLLVVGMVAFSFWASMWDLHHTGVAVLGRLTDIEATLLVVLFLGAAGLAGTDALHVGKPWVKPVNLLVVVTVLGAGGQVVASLRRPSSAIPRLPALAVGANLGLLAAWYVLAGGAAPAAAVAAVMGFVTARASLRLIHDRIYKRQTPTWDGASLALSCAAIATTLLGPDAARWQPGIAWGLLAVLASWHAWSLFRILARTARLLRT